MSEACAPHAATKVQSPFAGGTLLPLHRYYELMRQSRQLLPASAMSLARQIFAGCCQLPAACGIFPMLSLRIFPKMPGPLLRRSHRVHVPVSSSVSSAFLASRKDESASRFIR